MIDAPTTLTGVFLSRSPPPSAFHSEGIRSGNDGALPDVGEHLAGEVECGRDGGERAVLEHRLLTGPDRADGHAAPAGSSG